MRMRLIAFLLAGFALLGTGAMIITDNAAAQTMPDGSRDCGREKPEPTTS